MTQELIVDKLKDLSDTDRKVLRFILQHGSPRRSELAEEFTLPVADDAITRARAVHLLDVDTSTYRCSIKPHWAQLLRDELFKS